MNRSFSNSPRRQGDSTANFFHQNARGVSTALLACPFFSDTGPLRVLREQGCETIRLIVRLCESTRADALKEVFGFEGLRIRYFTGGNFHAKFYVLDGLALVGSANMTMGGMRRNRELSIVVSSSDEQFDEIPALFDELWEEAEVLTPNALENFASWQRTLADVALPPMAGVPQADPATIRVNSAHVTPERGHLRTFQRYYYEGLIPSHRIIEESFAAFGSRNPQYANCSVKYEIESFLSWVKLEFTTDEDYASAPTKRDDDIRHNVADYAAKWIEADDPPTRMRVERIRLLNDFFTTPEALQKASFDELTDALTGCAAFEEQLRFTQGGLEPMLKQFKRDNSEQNVKACFRHLVFGSEEFVKRTYDCIYSNRYKLRHFGRSCIFELFGWVNREDIPPFNNRAIKAMRFLGCDVRP